MSDNNEHVLYVFVFVNDLMARVARSTLLTSRTTYIFSNDVTMGVETMWSAVQDEQSRESWHLQIYYIYIYIYFVFKNISKI